MPDTVTALTTGVSSSAGTCAHCGQPVGESDGTATIDFCCPGCAAAYQIVGGLGLGAYYVRRCLDPAARPTRPDAEGAPDVTALVCAGDAGRSKLYLMVEGLQCAACVWLIESVLTRQPGVESARLNMTTRRLTLEWRTGEVGPNELVALVARLGYRLVPFDPVRLARTEAKTERELLRAMAVAGFAAGNVMIISVGVWAGYSGDMGPATRTLMHWISALICLPAILYAVRPFLRSALAALAAWRTNMDVPITVGVTLATGMSLFETVQGGHYAYFDSAVTLLFFLLIGRFLDLRARGRARSAAEHLVALGAATATVIDAEGRVVVIPTDQVAVGMTVLVTAGGQIPVDGEVVDGRSDVDVSLVTGETVPAPAGPGDRLFAGSLNLTAPLRLTVSAVGERTLLAEIVRLMEVAEQGRASVIALADRIARFYAPVVHLCALTTFLGWLLIAGASWQNSLMTAISVLIVTCPCALALAVPVVQVVASGRLMRRGILLKSATALERLALVDTVVFDKTGTLTEGRPQPLLAGWSDSDLRLAASLAGASRHPLAAALFRAVPGTPVARGVREHPGEGLSLVTADGEVRLGSHAFVGSESASASETGATPELWLRRPGAPPARMIFADQARNDAAAVVRQLTKNGFRVVLLSGDQASAVAAMAEQLGIREWHGSHTPIAKTAFLRELAANGAKVLMVGDGLNDAPALAGAFVSMSPATAVEISQTAADIVFQGRLLGAVPEVLETARRARRLVRQNFAFTFLYNVLTIPLAVAGMVTPLIAAAAMSSSSVLVIVNALRLSGRRVAAPLERTR